MAGRKELVKEKTKGSCKIRNIVFYFKILTSFFCTKFYHSGKGAVICITMEQKERGEDKIVLNIKHFKIL